MFTLEERKWLLKHLEGIIQAMQEDVDISGRYADLEMAEQLVAKLKQ